MSWLVKNSDEGQPRPPMFQQGKQHHSVISLVFANSSVKLYPLYAGSVLFRHNIISICLASCNHGTGLYSRHKSFLTSKPCLPVAAGSLVAEAVRRLENKVDKVRLNACAVQPINSL